MEQQEARIYIEREAQGASFLAKFPLCLAFPPSLVSIKGGSNQKTEAKESVGGKQKKKGAKRTTLSPRDALKIQRIVLEIKGHV